METEKKYLKTIEEVSDALAAGKVIYNKYKTKIWKDKNGFIVSETKGGDKFLNDYMFTQDDEPYILEPKPLEVKLYHLYKDGSGDKFFIGKCRENISGAIEFMGVGQSDGLGFFLKSGERLHRGGFSCFNLVEELADLSKYFEKEPKNAKNN